MMSQWADQGSVYLEGRSLTAEPPDLATSIFYLLP